MRTPHPGTWRKRLNEFLEKGIGRELLILLGFFALTAAMTWPWVTRMRDAVADEGDPYMIAWSLWWNYHQTFSDPLNLFHANVFYPYKYTLAFSEHEYGIALIFFPLFALGLRPLTVQAVATFCGFAFCGYAQFRLMRTLTGCTWAAIVSGIVFAFIPNRFHLLSHLHYLFAAWIPLLLEALILFARKRTWPRAAWMGVAFVMNALTSTSYFILTLVPLALSVGYLVVLYRIARDRAFWLRGAAAVGVGSLILLPFMLPYYFVVKLYGLIRTSEEIALNSPTPSTWLAAADRHRLWKGLGDNIPGLKREGLFPGIIPVLLSLPAFGWPTKESTTEIPDAAAPNPWRKRIVVILDVVAVLLLICFLVVFGYQAARPRPLGIDLFKVLTATRSFFLFTIVIVFRLGLAYPNVWQRPGRRNLIESIQFSRRGETFALGVIWTLCGFFGTLGTNFYINRVLYDFVFLFRAIRIPSHWSMVAFVGLALLAALGTQRLAERIVEWRDHSRIPALSTTQIRAAIFIICGIALLFEMRAAPLRFVRGKVFPDELTLRLKNTSMRGGLVELPHDLGKVLPHRYMLRSADHQKPLVNGTSSFVSPMTTQIADMTLKNPIDSRFMDLLEKIPASYLVVHTSELSPDKQLDYEAFLIRNILANRLRFIRSYGNRDDLYAVVKTEPDVETEAALPFSDTVKEWSALVKDDPIHILGQHRKSSQTIFRFYVLTYGRLPTYVEFIRDVESIGEGVWIGAVDDQPKLEEKLRAFAEQWIRSGDFESAYKSQADEVFVEALLRNSAIALNPDERSALIGRLANKTATRADILMELVNNEGFRKNEEARAVVLLHYFGYLRRNPNDPPDNNLDGFNHWVSVIKRGEDERTLATAFQTSFEYERIRGKLPQSPVPAKD